MGHLLPNNAGNVVKEIYYLGLWNIALLVPYIAGMLLKRRKETVSEAFLNWMMKPLLLLAFILFVTLGLYINMYMFSVLDKAALLAGGAIPFIGFLVGGAATLLAKQGRAAAKTTAIETAVTNCIAVIIAIRFTLPQPEADMASAGVMWVFFFTPVPFLLMFVIQKARGILMSYFDKKELEKEQQETILQSFAAITHNALQIGGINRENNNINDVVYSVDNDTGENCERAMLLRRLSRHSDPSHVIANNIACMELSPSHSDPQESTSQDVVLDAQSQSS